MKEENKISRNIIGRTIKIDIPSLYGNQDIKATRQMSKEVREEFDALLDSYNNKPSKAAYSRVLKFLEIKPVKIIEKKKAAPKKKAVAKKKETKAKTETKPVKIVVKAHSTTLYITMPSFGNDKAEKLKLSKITKEIREKEGFDESVNKFNEKNTITGYKKVKRFINKYSKKGDLDKEAIAKSAKRNKTKKKKVEKAKIKKLARALFNNTLTLKEDAKTGLLYLEEFEDKVLMPQRLSDRIKDYMKKKRDYKRLINFWSLCLLNPSAEARDKFFDYIDNHESFIITEYGNLVTYRRVLVKEKVKTEQKYPDWVTNAIAIAKLKRKGLSTHFLMGQGDVTYADSNGDAIMERLNIVHYKDVVSDYKKNTAYSIKDMDKVEEDQFSKSLHSKVLFDGMSLKELSEAYENQPKEHQTVYTDNHTKTFRIFIGQEVRMPRIDCDPNINVDCGTGLHTGSPAFVKGGGYFGAVVIACLVNPMDVVSVPSYDTGKMRSSAYFPAMVITSNVIERIEEEKIEEWDNLYGKYQEERMVKILSGDMGDIEPKDKEVYKGLQSKVNLEKIKKLISSRVVYGS